MKFYKYKKFLIFSSIALISCSNSAKCLWYLETLNVEVLQTEDIKRDIICAVLDSGFNYSFSSYFESNVMDEINLLEDDGEVINLHGTYVSMLIASKQYGVDSNIKILPIRIVNDAGFTNSSLLYSGIATAILNNANVINISLGSNYYSEDIESIISENKNTYFIASVGDLNQNEFLYPANYRNVYAVSAVDKNGVISSSSNKSSTKDSIRAPGLEINLPNKEGDEVLKNGSSFSTALVSGIVSSCLLRHCLNEYNLKNNLLYINSLLNATMFMEVK